MKKWAFCVILLVTLPAFATIASVQSNAKWTCTGTSSPITCSVVLTTQPTVTGHLLAVWSFWQSTSTYTASVQDSQLNGVNQFFPGAVGPTLQSTSNTSAQIFYAANITGSTPPNKDTVTVTFTCVSTCTSPSITAGGIVAVEYSGLDQNYPLDSVSAGYSTSGNPTTLMDSGTAAPANGNLLVFGGGTTDTGTASLIINSPFAVIQKNSGSITEQMIVSASMSLPQGNNTLQRAQASSTATGNWLMQMAVFRDASWTVANTWSPARIGNIRWADQFPGSDIGVKINNAYADCPAAGCVIKISAGSYSFSTPVAFGSVASGGTINSGKPVVLDCGGGSNGYTPTNGAVQLNYTGTTGTAAITFNDGGFTGAGMKGCNLLGQSASNAIAGLVCGATSGMYGTPSGDNGVCEGHHFEGDDISGFGVGVMIGGSAFLNTFSVMGVHDNGQNLTLTGSYGNESNKFVGGVLSNQPAIGFVQNCVDTSLATAAYDMEFIGVSLDSCGVNIIGNSSLAGGHRFRFIGSHLENANNPTAKPFITVGATCTQCNVQLDATDIQEDGTGTGRTAFILNNNTNLTLGPSAVIIYGGHMYASCDGPGGTCTVPTDFSVIKDTGGGNVASVQNVYKSGSATSDVSGGSQWVSFDWGNLNIGGSQYPSISFNSGVLISSKNPTVTPGSGFGTGADVTANSNGTASFQVSVGITASSTGTVTMPIAAPTGWNCSCTDITTFSSTVFQCRATPGTTTTIGLANLDTSGVNANWAVNDLLDVSCFAR